MSNYSLQDACNLLAINNRQLHKLLAIASIVPVTASNDGRRQELTADQIEQVRLLHQAQASVAVVHNGDLTRRVEVLERELRLLRSELLGTRRTRLEASERRVSPVERPQHVERPHNTIGGDGLVAKREAARVAVEHGANSWSAALDWQWQDDDRQDRGTVVARVHAYLASHPRAGRWVICQDAECSCQALP